MPFLDGWAKLTKLGIGYRRYHNVAELSLWFKAFLEDRHLKVCYIAGHGEKGRLVGLTHEMISLQEVAAATASPTSTGCQGKGILLGVCEVGTRLEQFLETCSAHIEWVAGYAREVPWLEATLCDLLFIEYMVRGRWRRDEQGFRYKNGILVSQRPSHAVQAAEWVKADYELAATCGFEAHDRRTHRQSP